MNKPKIRILVVEDDLVDRMACSRALAKDTSNQYVLSEAETGQDGIQLARTQKLDCILLDYKLPDMSGLEFLTGLTDESDDIQIPVIMLTGADNAAIAIEAMKRGAQDYLVKDTNSQYLELLPTVVQHALRERKGIEALRLHNSRMEGMVKKRTEQFETRAGVLESANANLVNRLEASKQAEATLKEYASRLEDLYQNAPCAYCVLDHDGRFIQVNTAGLELFGGMREDVVGKMKLTDFLTPASKEKFQDSSLNAQGVIPGLELEITRKNGTLLTVLLSANTLKDASGNFLQNRVMLFDITKRKLVGQGS